MRSKRWLLIIFLAVTSLVLVSGGTVLLLHQRDITAENTIQTAYVASVIDGDTLILDSGEVVRLIGIDSPEKGDKFYYEAKDKLASLVGHYTVKLVRDKEDKDQYGRLLRYIWLSNIFVNGEMVRTGYATSYPYPPNLKYVYVFDRYEQEARQAAIGMWAKDTSTFKAPILSIPEPTELYTPTPRPTLKLPSILK